MITCLLISTSTLQNSFHIKYCKRALRAFYDPQDDYVTDKTVELHHLTDLFISVSNSRPFRLASDKFPESDRPRENLVCSKVKELKILV